VLAVAGKGEDEDASALLQGAHGAVGWIGALRAGAIDVPDFSQR
jgi:hypothetical protein